MASRRPPRHSRSVYIGKNRYSLTIHAFPASSPFSAAPTVQRVLAQLRRTATAQRFAVLAFCFMPNHLHVIVEALDDACDLVRFVTLFKQYQGFEHRRETGERLWQEGFYDRVLRVEEATADAIRYVLADPVRAGLVTAVEKWPFSGSEVFDIRYLDG